MVDSELWEHGEPQMVFELGSEDSEEDRVWGRLAKR